MSNKATSLMVSQVSNLQRIVRRELTGETKW